MVVTIEAIIMTSEELRKMQKIELEMLIEVDRICRKYDIKYSIDGGTLLGAVRHKGFIPWDDDVDVIMLREEYEKFYNACKNELNTDKFFLQEYRTDPHYIFGYEKIRRNNTEFVRASQEKLNQRTGVCIDIFVADNVPDNFVIRRIHLFLCYLIRKMLYAKMGKDTAPNFFLRLWYKFISIVPRDTIFALRNIIAKKCNKKRTQLIRHMTYPYKLSRYGMPRECFDDYIELDFEGRKFKAFKNYDLYLTSLYGDYMTLPPKEEQKAHHLDIAKLSLDVEVDV